MKIFEFFSCTSPQTHKAVSHFFSKPTSLTTLRLWPSFSGHVWPTASPPVAPACALPMRPSFPACPHLLLFPSLSYLFLFPEHEEGSGSLSYPPGKTSTSLTSVCSFFVPVWEAAPPAPLHSAASILSLLASNPPASPSISRRTHGSFHRFHHAVRHRLAPAHATSQLRANLPLSTDSRVRYQAGAPPASLLSGQIQLGKNESQLVPVPDQ